MNVYDNFQLQGTDYDQFVEELNDVVKNTENINIKNNSFKFLSFQGINKGVYEFALIDSDTINKFNAFLTSFPKVSITPKEEELPFFEEMKNTSGLIIIDSANEEKDTLLLVSKSAIPSLADRAGIKGDLVQLDGVKGNLIQPQSIIRNLYIAQGLLFEFEKGNKQKYATQIVYRKQRVTSHYKELKKIFAFMGSRFVKSPLTNIVAISDEIFKTGLFDINNTENPEKVACHKWSITHQLSSIFLEFPNTGKNFKEKYHLPDLIIPGICIADSDVGKSSFTISKTFRFKNTEPLVYDTQTWEHTKETSEFLKEALLYTYSSKNSFTELCEMFKSLLETEVKPNKAGIVYKDVVKEAQLVKAIGKKRTMALIAKLKDDFLEDPAKTPANEYEIAKNIILAQRYFTEMPEYALIKLSEALGHVPFLGRKGLSVKWED